MNILTESLRDFFRPLWKHPKIFWGTVIPLSILGAVTEIFYKEHSEIMAWILVVMVLPSVIYMVWIDRKDDD